jgi:hypothetical protein
VDIGPSVTLITATFQLDCTKAHWRADNTVAPTVAFTLCWLHLGIGSTNTAASPRSVRVPWLKRTGFPFHLKGLLDEEIYDSYKVLLDRELESDKFDDPVLIRIIVTISRDFCYEKHMSYTVICRLIAK